MFTIKKFTATIFTLVVILFLPSWLFSQTYLISPTGDGGFETASTMAGNGWTAVNDASNYFEVGTVATQYAGSYGTYVTQSGGTNTYTTTSAKTSHFYRDITIPSNASNVTLNFYWKGKGESGWDRGLVYVAPTSVTPTATSPASNSTTLTGSYNTSGAVSNSYVWIQPSFAQTSYVISSNIDLSVFAGSTIRLIFTWQNDGSGGTTPGIAFDNISLSYTPLTIYKSVQTGNWNSTSTWNSSTDGGSTWSAAGSTPTSADGSITIQNGHNVTVSASVTADQITVSSGGTLTVASGQTLTINDGTSNDLSITGTFVNNGTVTNNGQIQVNSGGYYNHANGSSIPSGISWGSSGSAGTLEVSGSATCSNVVSVSTTSELYNLIWSSSGSMPDAFSGSGTATLCNGSFTQSAGAFRVAFSGSGSSSTLTIGGDCTISGGTMTITQTTGSQGWGVVNVSGNFTLSSGTLNMSTGNTATKSELYVAGNFTHSGGTLSNTSTTTTSEIHFDGGGTTQTWNSSAGSTYTKVNYYIDASAVVETSSNIITGTSASTTISSSGTLAIPASYTFSGAGSFTVASGGKIKIANANGIAASASSGAVQTTTRTYNAGGTYEYNGSGNQVTGDGLPSPLSGGLIINNSQAITSSSTGVTLSQSTSVYYAALTLTQGLLTTSGSSLVTIVGSGSSYTAGDNSAIATGSSSSYINGPLRRKPTGTGGVPTSSTMNYPVGAGGRFLPFTVTQYSISAGTGDLIVTAYSANTSGSSGACSLTTTEYWNMYQNTNVQISSMLVKLGKAESLSSLNDVQSSGSTSTATANVAYTAKGGSTSTSGGINYVTSSTTVTVSSNAGGAIYNYFTLGQVTPTISSQPSTSTQTVCYNGSTTALTVSANSSTYQWYSNASNSNSGGTLLTGETSSSYTPLSTTVGTLYYYVVLGSGGCTTTSNVSGAVNIVGLSGTYSVGASNIVGEAGHYATITAAIADYNTKCMIGPVIFALTDNSYSGSETFPLAINLNSSASSTNTLTIRPNTGVSSVVISGANATAIFSLDGAYYVTIDGRAGGSGASQLTIRNTNTSGSAIRFINDATYSTVKYCTIEGSASSASTILFSTTTGSTGNDNNTIDNNTIQNYTGQNHYYAINSTGTAAKTNDNITISNNSIANAKHSGIFINSNTSSWTISGNSFYQTASVTPGNNMYGIYVNTGNTYTVSGNYIGGSAASCSGTATFSTSTYTLTGMYFNCTSGSNTITSNTISGISYTTSTATAIAFTGLSLNGSSNYTVGTSGNGNIFGASSGTGSIAIADNGSGTNGFRIIDVQSTGTNAINYNTFGSITLTGSNIASTTSVIYVNAGTNTITYNTIGNSTANNITLLDDNQLHGIYAYDAASATTVTISYNTIQNFAQTSGGGTDQELVGIEVYLLGADFTISSNTINSFNTTTTATYGVQGIRFSCSFSNTTASNITGNTIYDFNNTSSSGIPHVVGIKMDGYNTTIQKNKIYQLTSTRASCYLVGIEISHAAGTTKVYNNLIYINNGANTTDVYIYGLNSNGGSHNIYHNSVYIYGSSSAQVYPQSAFLIDGALSGFTIVNKNNIYINARTGGASGKHYAMNYSCSTAPTYTEDYNYLQATTASQLGVYSSTDKTFAAWNTSSGASNNNNSTGITIGTDGAPSTIATTSTGVNLTATVSDDIADVTRSNPPKKGCYESAANYYSNTSAANTSATTLSNWNSKSDGTGSSPSSFATSGNFYIQSGHKYQLSSTWTGGASATIVVQSGGTLDFNGQTLSTWLGLTINGTGVSSAGAITNTSSSSSSISIPVTLGAASTIVSSGSGGLTLTGNITNAGYTLTVDGANATTISTGVISGSGGLTKAGAGTLTLSGTNTYTGVTTINAGTISIGTLGNGGVAGNLGQATNTVTNIVLGGGTLTYTGATASSDRGISLTAATSSTINVSTNTLTLSAEIGNSTSGALIKSGAGTLELTGSNTFTGGMTLSAGTLNIGHNSALGTGTFTISGGTVDAITSAKTITNAMSIGGSFTFTGTQNLIQGTGTITLTASPTLTCSANTLELGGVISGAYTLTKAGAGTLQLTGNNTFSSGTTLNAGTLNIGHNSALGTGTFTISGGTVDAITSAKTITNAMSIGGSFTFTGTQNLTQGTGTVTLTASPTLTCSANTLELGGVISGAYTLTKAGAGTLQLTGNNTFSSGTTLNAGTLNIGHNSALGTGTFTISGGTVDAITSAKTITNAMSIGGSFTFTGTQNLTQGTGTITLTATPTLTCSANTLTFGGIVGGAFGLTKAGAGTLVLTGANTYTGSTTINAGVVNIQHATALGTTAGGTTVASGAALQIQGGITVGSESLSLNNDGVSSTGSLRSVSGANTFGGNITLSTNAVRINSDASTLTLSGTITNGAINLTLGGAGNITTNGVIGSGAGTLTKDGAGTLTLGATHTFTGAMSISAGTVTVAANQSLSSTLTLSAGTLALSTYTFAVAGATTIAGTLTISSGTFDANGSFDATGGAVTFSGAGYLYLGSTVTSLGTFTRGTASGSTVSYDASGAQNVAAVNYYNLTTAGSGVKTLQGDIDISGSDGDGILTVGSGTTFAIGDYNVTHTNLDDVGTENNTVSGTVTLNNGTWTPTYGQSANLTTSGSITVTGTGIIYLRGGRGHTLGTFTAGSGTVYYSRNGNQTVQANTFNHLIIDGNTGTKTLGGNITVGGDFTVTANGTAFSLSSYTLNLAGNFTNNGTFTSSTGTVVFNGSSAQTISGTTDPAFYNLTMNNSSTGVTLGLNTSMTNTLTLTAGKLKTSTYTLTLGTNGVNATVPAGSSGSYIVAYDNSGSIGYVKQFINSNTSYNFPLGDATNFTPYTLTLNSNGGLSTPFITTYTKAAKVTNLSASFTSFINRSWEITSSGITSPNYNVVMTYVAGDVTGTESGLLPVKRSITAGPTITWYAPTGSSFTAATLVGTGSVNAGTHTLTWNNVTSFSLFGGAGNQASALPVELFSFDVAKKDRQVLINWSTASEKDAQYFIVQRSQDGKNFENVDIVDAVGNSKTLVDYASIDKNPLLGLSYYRLKEVDINGGFYYSPVRSVYFDAETEDALIKVYPNPVVNDEFTIAFDVSLSGEYALTMLDETGRIVANETIQIDSKGFEYKTTTSNLKTGYYIVNVSQNDKIIATNKVLIIK